MIVRTKGDLNGDPDAVSVVSEGGLEGLLGRIGTHFEDQVAKAGLAASVRDAEALTSAADALVAAQVAIEADIADIVALHLRGAAGSLQGIIGEVTPDEVLDEVFRTFCLGK